MTVERFDPSLDRLAVLRALLLRAAGAAGVGTLATCGLPLTSRPIVDSPTLSGRPGTGDTLIAAPIPDDAFDPVGLVQEFFGAVAGRLRLDADITRADQRAHAFLTPKARGAWQGGGQVTVVRRPAPQNAERRRGRRARGRPGPAGRVLARDGTVVQLPASVTTEPRTLRVTHRPVARRVGVGFG